MYTNKLMLEKWSIDKTMTCNRPCLQKYPGKAWMTGSEYTYIQDQLDQEALVELVYISSFPTDSER